MVAISDKIEQDFALMATNPLGDIYIGGIDGYLGEGAKLMRIGLERNLGATVHYTSCCSSDALTMLDRGLIDFAIVSQIVRIDHYEAIRFAKKGQWIALMRADNPLATKERLVVEDLAQEPLVMYDQALKTPYEYNSLAQWFGDSFPRLNIVATSNLTAALISLAQEGIGTLLTWESIATISTHDMAIIPLCPELAARGALVWHKDRPLSPAATRYLSLLKELLDTGVIP
jgi:DNA-binding transcriptional LysR family regulator